MDPRRERTYADGRDDGHGRDDMGHGRRDAGHDRDTYPYDHEPAAGPRRDEDAARTQPPGATDPWDEGDWGRHGHDQDGDRW